jgi:hypothetical protein
MFVLFICSYVFAQADKSKDKEIECPDISITGQPTAVASGEIQKFTLTINGKDIDEEKIKIVWSVDNGKIVNGQGTKTLSVTNTENTDETITVTAEVTIGECQLSASETGIICNCPEPILIDEFGKITEEDVLARIDGFISELQNNPGDQDYIIDYGSAKHIARREKLIRNQLNFRRFPIDRIVFVNGGTEKEIRTRFWRVPPGADASVID